MSDPAARVAVLIPAFQPGPELVATARGLAADDLVDRIVVVDDGSDRTCRPLFAEVARLPKVEVLRHLTNLGKGAALKTGINHVGVHGDGLGGLVTADADGQHAVEDILAVGRALVAAPDRLVLGVRRFGADVPWRSRFGNTATRFFMRVIGGCDVTDTQTGLRGIPRALFPTLLRRRSTGYEFELDMLLTSRRQGIALQEVPIRTIYVDGNRGSHFNPILDSMRIYFVLLRFFASSLASALVDNLVFIATFWATRNVLLSQALARLVSGSVNFLANKNLVFHSHGRSPTLAARYVALVLFSGALTYFLIRMLVSFLGVPVIPAKLVAETAVFFFNFLVQRDLVFAPPAGNGGEDGRGRSRAATS